LLFHCSLFCFSFFRCSFVLMFFLSLLYASLLPRFGVPFLVMIWFCCSFVSLLLHDILGILLNLLLFFCNSLFHCSTFAYLFFGIDWYFPLLHFSCTCWNSVLEFEAQFNL
jgi:hypothetical protein